MLTHQAQDALLVDPLAVHVAKARPHPPIPPEGVLSLKRPDALDQGPVARRHFRGALPAHGHTSSLFFKRERELPDERLEPGILALQARRALAVTADAICPLSADVICPPT